MRAEEDNMKKLDKKTRRGLLVDGLFIAGSVLTAVGAGLYALPLGFITGGVLAIVGAVLAARGGD